MCNWRRLLGEKNHIKTLQRLNALNGIVEIDNNVLKTLLDNYSGVKGTPMFKMQLKKVMMVM